MEWYRLLDTCLLNFYRELRNFLRELSKKLDGEV